MKNNIEVILDEQGIELIVSYEYELSESQREVGHGVHEVGLSVETELKSVDIVIKGDSTNILDKLTTKQKEGILDLLTYK